jgi:glycosyltransferase involved in cell wall biosynthesis
MHSRREAGFFEYGGDKMSIGSFTIIKNEILWIERHIKEWLPYLDQMVFFDGNSTDGTLEILKKYRVTLVENKDPKNLQEDYVRIFNECLRTLDTDFAIFLHPDMFPISGAGKLKHLTGLAAYTHMRVFGGEPNGQIYEETGRANAWKNIMRLRNPDLGLHYYGYYGAANEDLYFEDITGDDHIFYGTNFKAYPYPIFDSDCIIGHYSDVRPYERRLQRMIYSLMNQGLTKEQAAKIAPNHPRVSLKSGDGVEFKESQCLN